MTKAAPTKLTASEVRQWKNSQLFSIRRWRKYATTDHDSFWIIQDEVKRRCEATDFGRKPEEWPGQDDLPKIKINREKFLKWKARIGS